MKWERARRSSNIEDRRGRPVARAAGGFSIMGVLIVLGISWLTGQNPIELLGLLQQQGGQAQQSPAGAPPADDPRAAFVGSILGETEDVWGAFFQQSGNRYPAPTLVLFSGSVQSACGGATAASGPFYCPGDQKVYLDTVFFNEMQQRLGGGGDFAEAYVIAHEVGHHIQTLTGVSQQVTDLRRRGQNVEGADGPLVRLELQADCYAGVWANAAQRRHNWLEAGDIEEALNTATAIGDDRLQRQARGTVIPDSFTHGSSAQRVRWFRIGFEGGDPNRCDTFAAAQL
ncbi:MAG: neutral zinc metallopeptidase [Xanthomonadales bacterium]|nr:neutral zinc metallopeptidase [Xanthomonadales bacterium]MCB1633136.1 neutral zinc metallopeptidase [Xanthomonadales bacterium]